MDNFWFSFKLETPEPGGQPVDILRQADRALRPGRYPGFICFFEKKGDKPVYPPDFYRMDLQFSAQIHAMHRKILC